MTKFETMPHKEEKVKSYVLYVYESDPYYHVEVYKGDKKVDDHLLMNDNTELESLKRKYERM